MKKKENMLWTFKVEKSCVVTWKQLYVFEIHNYNPLSLLLIYNISDKFYTSINLLLKADNF